MNHYEKLYFSLVNLENDNDKEPMIALCQFFIQENNNPFFIQDIDLKKLHDFYQKNNNFYLSVFFNSMQYYNADEDALSKNLELEFKNILFKFKKHNEKCNIKYLINKSENINVKKYISFLKEHNIEINLKNMILFLDEKKIKKICFNNEKIPIFNLKKCNLISL